MALFLFPLFLLISSCFQQAPLPVISGKTMGTTYSVQIPGLNPQHTSSLESALESELLDINNSMSTYQADSAISAFNQSDVTAWIDIPPNLATVVAAALEISVASDGAFDPTVGPLIERWGFGSADSESIPPAPQEISQLLRGVGYQHLHLRVDPPALRKDIPALSIDLSAIAKGYAVDRLSEIVSDFGYEHHLVEIGGELRVTGFRDKKTKWRIGVERPGVQGTDIQESLALTGGGVASSGDYRNFRKASGKRYSHIIDPQNGMPVEHGLAAVTVVANTAMHADGWATALMVLGAERGRDIALRHSLAAQFIEHGDHGFKVSATSLYSQLPSE